MAFVLALLLLLVPSPALLSPHLQMGTQHLSRDVKSQPIKVVISDTCAQDGAKEREMDLDPDAPLVLTHRIHLVPGSGSGCGECEVDFAALRERIERLEKEVSDLREKCGGPEGCCTSQQSKGAVCTTVRPTTDECPDDCSDQGRCVDGKCVCFAGFSGPDCSTADCPDDCNRRGKCVDGQCVCDPGFTGPDCSSSNCPDNCSNWGHCVNGRCMCESGFTGEDCSERSCPGNCSNRGRCVNGRCVCESGFTGPECGTHSCPENCNKRGRCVNGRCVCESGFTGEDCFERSCPGNCSNRGRCVNGQCVCDPGLSGPDCSVSVCPDDCNNRGQCVNGKCVCESGFTGPDCSSRSCPRDCSDRGRCVDGQCVCESGFTGPDCSSKSCPNNCNNKGICVNGKCVCEVGFSGQDCSTKTCPNNCSNKGRCMRGRCVCRRGFMGSDCSECQSGFTGENCDTALAGVSRLSTRDITESSVTLFWMPPAMQYDTYHITFTSRKETDQKISSKIIGRLSTYTQIGLAAGQEYTVSITGEKDGMMGTESTAEFTTLIPGPKDLHVVKTSTTSVVVQWEKVQGEIDRYVLSIAPNQTDGASRLPEMNLPPERDSAQIDGLQPGRLYDISLVAEKDSIRSLPAAVQATPGEASAPAAGITVGRVNMQVEAGNNTEIPPRSTNTTLFQQKLNKGGQVTNRKMENSERNGHISRLKPGTLVQPGEKRPLPAGKHGMFLKPGVQPGIIRRPSGPETHFNSTQIGMKRGIVVASSNKNPLRPRNAPVSRRKPMALTRKERRYQEGIIENSLSGESDETAGNASPSSTVQKHTARPLPLPNATESTEEPTITTEKNLTAYLNGTKCVRKVLVGYRKIHGNMSDGSTLSKNMEVIVGHVNGNDLLHRLLTGRSAANEMEGTGPDEPRPTAEISEARRSVRKEEVDEENANVMKATPLSTRQPETTLHLFLIPTPPPPPLSPAEPERVKQHPARNPSITERPSRTKTSQASSPSVRRQPTRPKPPGLSSPPLGGTPQKNKHPSSVLDSGFQKEPLIEKEELNSGIPTVRENRDSTPGPAQVSNTPVPVKPPSNHNTVMQNGSTDASHLMPYRRTPHRGFVPRRPNVSPFHNRTRPNLEPPQHPSRGSVRRPFPLKPVIRNGTIRRVALIQPINPALTPPKENGTGIKIRPEITDNKTEGATGGHAANTHSQRQHHGTTQLGPNIRKNGNSDSSFSTEHLMENHTQTQEYVLSEADDSIEHVGVKNATLTGFVLTWGAPKGKFKHFTITRTELGQENTGKDQTDKEGEEKEETREDEADNGKGLKTMVAKRRSKGKSAVLKLVPDVLSAKTNTSVENMTSVLPGSARSHQMTNLSPQTRYSVSIFGTGPTFRSKTHSLVIHTGPESPSDLVFSDVTDSSFTVSWTKPKSKVSGFKITHMHVQEGEPISVSVDSETLRLSLSPMSPGSTYEVSVMSVRGQDESDSIKDTVTTLPDPPTDLRAINVTDSKALLLWRPALATVDHYIIEYTSEAEAPGSGITIKVSGNAAEQQLQALQASMRYSVSIQSRLGEKSSSRATATFSTSSGSGKTADGPRDLKASQVTPRTAVLSWKPPVSAVTGYKLSYYTEGQDVKEVILEPTANQFKLSRLMSSSAYTARLQAERGGLYMTALTTQFTTGNLRFPFPTDCSQERQNGVLESGIAEVFPHGRTGASLMVYCDMETDGGGWTVFQRRNDGKTDFFRSWREYSRGFGALDGEFWLGNELLHNFTKMSPMSLRVDLRTGDESVYARYSSFSVDNAKKHYAIRISGYSGTAGDSLTYHNGRTFSTRDRDPRPFITRCAMSYRGGWWYKNCHEANLNGLYNTDTNHQGVIWTAWKGKDFSIPFTEMKFRPATFRP